MGINKKKFIEGFTSLGNEKGISNENLQQILADSFKVAFAKKIEDEYRFDKKPTKSGSSNKNKDAVKLPDALIRAEVDLNKAKVNCFRQWKVVPEDEIQDDYIEISLEDAKEKNPKLKLGDFYEEELDIATLTDRDVNRFMSNFRQRIAKAEKDALLENYASKIGTIVTGTVEKSDVRNVIVNLGRTSVTLTSRDLIGDERYAPGDSIKVYIEGIGKDKDDKKGSLIKASRSCEGFLRQLFENEVHEILDGTVVIKAIARIAGKRAKVCVYSNDSNVDPSGACIGTNGNRIQAIVSQLGNAKDSKEKIDIITYSPNLGVFIAELLRPGKILGMNIDEEKKEVLAVCDDETLIGAIGYKGINAILARQVTGYKVNVISETKAKEEGVEYKTIDEYEVEAREEERRQFRVRQEELKAKINKVGDEVAVAEETSVETTVEEVPAQEEIPVETEVKAEESVKEEAPVEEEKTETLVEEVKETVVEEKHAEPAPKKNEEPVELHEVKTTTTIESLEASLEEEKKEKQNSKQNFKKKKKEKKSSDTKEEKKTIRKMDIYTDEELEALDNEDEDIDSYDDEDYSEYDDDNYYEDR